MICIYFCFPLFCFVFLFCFVLFCFFKYFSLLSVTYRGCLAPGVSSEICAPFRDFFPKKLQSGRPKTSLSHFQKWKERKKGKGHTPKLIYTFHQRCRNRVFNNCHPSSSPFSEKSYVKRKYDFLFSFTNKLLVLERFAWWITLKGYCNPVPDFWRFCLFSQKIKQRWTKCPIDLIRNVQGTQKSHFSFIRDYGYEVTVNNVWNSIFSMFWLNKSITTWVSQIPV